MTPMEMARKAVNYLPETDYPPILHTKEQIENFAVLVAEATKEKAAKVCEAFVPDSNPAFEPIEEQIAAAIRSMK